jgi:crotonobetainyl-CoA:carnitine CoA-transferase CaiB-like acyl-CoA transferase
MTDIQARSPSIEDDRPLAGYTVLDFTRVLSGPYCTKMLADLGARVIKIERPGEGDEVRYVGLQLNPERSDQSAYFARMNAGKQSIAIDFANPAARPLVLDLVRTADVVVENFSPGVMAKYGFDDAGLRAVRPDVVFCSISGFGQTGPLKSMQAYAHLVNAFSGMMDLDRSGFLEPKASNLQAADVLAGAHAFGSICAALLRRARTGKGARLDVSMLECLIAADDVNFPTLLNGGAVARQPRTGMVVLPIGERYVAMQVGSVPAMWKRVTEMIGRPDLHEDPRFFTPAARRDNWPALLEILGQWLSTFGSVDDAVKTLAASRIPGVPMLLPEEVIEHPHLAQRGAFPQVPHPVEGQARVTAQPFQLDGEPVVPAGPVPYRIGEHTRSVLTDWLGYSQEQVTGLISQGVVEQA